MLSRESGLVRLCVLRWRQRTSRKWLTAEVGKEKDRLTQLQQDLANLHQAWHDAIPGMERRRVQHQIDELEAVVKREAAAARARMTRVKSIMIPPEQAFPQRCLPSSCLARA
jgi:hypothetical protein